MTRADVTVVIPTYNRAHDLPATLAALAAQDPAPRAVIVVDNDSTDDTRAVVSSMTERLAAGGTTLEYRHRDPGGPAAARNLGWRSAPTARIAFVDSDVSLEPGWLAACGRLLDGDDGVGAVAGRVVYAHRPDLLNCYGGALGPIGLAWDAHEGDPVASAAAERDVLWANCSALLVRREALEAIDGFEDEFFYGYEDSDLGWRLNLCGWRVRLTPEATALHRVGREIGPAADAIVFHAGKNRLRSLITNWGPARLLWFGPAALAYGLADAALRRPRRPRIRALLWNLGHLAETLARRHRVQAVRRVDDKVIAALMEPRAFPRRRLGGLRRRPVDADTGAVAGTDDRV